MFARIRIGQPLRGEFTEIKINRFDLSNKERDDAIKKAIKDELYEFNELILGGPELKNNIHFDFSGDYLILWYSTNNQYRLQELPLEYNESTMYIDPNPRYFNEGFYIKTEIINSFNCPGCKDKKTNRWTHAGINGCLTTDKKENVSTPLQNSISEPVDRQPRASYYTPSSYTPFV